MDVGENVFAALNPFSDLKLVVTNQGNVIHYTGQYELFIYW